MSVGGFESAFIAAKSIEDLAGVGSTRDRKLSVTLEWTNFATDCISSRRFLLVYKHAFWRVGGVAGGHDDQTVKRRSELGQSIAQKAEAFFFVVA